MAVLRDARNPAPASGVYDAFRLRVRRARCPSRSPPLRLPDFFYRPMRRPAPWWAIALSILIHAVAMWEWWPRLEPLQIPAQDTTEPDVPLVARIERDAGSRASAPAPAIVEPTPPRRPPPERTRRPTPPVIAVPPRIEPRVEPPAPPPAPPAPPMPQARPAPQPAARPPTETDLSAYIDARRRERNAGAPSGATGTTSGPPTPDEERARRDRAIARNLAGINAVPGGDAQKNSGGIFRLRYVGYEDAEFTFFGWYGAANRRMMQKVEVRRGANPDIRIAVVRKMIDIIRQYEQQDFTWRSLRLGRDVTLSARVADTADLEAFLLLEFFEIEPSVGRAPAR